MLPNQMFFEENKFSDAVFLHGTGQERVNP
jgi:hypothetical protein